MNTNEQVDLFPDFEDDRQKEWNGMPEFIQEDKEPIKQLIVSFKNWDDYKAFRELVDQKITKNTQSIWYPKVEIDRMMNQRYINENYDKDEK